MCRGIVSEARDTGYGHAAAFIISWWDVLRVRGWLLCEAWCWPEWLWTEPTRPLLCFFFLKEHILAEILRSSSVHERRVKHHKLKTVWYSG